MFVSIRYVCLLMVVLALVGCEKESKEPNVGPTWTAVSVDEVRAIVGGKQIVRSNAGGNAVAGAVAGHLLVGSATTGAIVGAASTNHQVVSGTDVNSCQFSVTIQKKKYYFSGSRRGEGWQEDIETCALLAPGDVVKIVSYPGTARVDRIYGDCSTRLTWREYCLRSAL